jgi:ADP-heptose:LPS heptosyltransferase
LKIGIAWQGNPKYVADGQRSIPLRHFEALATVPGVTLVSLQKGPGSEQLAKLGGRFAVVDPGLELDAADVFVDSAAVMANLDLVVSSDTSVAHLAGALGVPVWVALTQMPDWRWLRERQDSPWYPSMRLVRQTERGNWGGVFERIAAELRQISGG